MRAVRYAPPSGGPRLGRLDSEVVVDAGPAGPGGFVPSAEAWAAIAAADGPRHALADVRLLHPVEPGKIICIGLNYADHAAESGAALPPAPLIFAKLTSALVGPGDPIVVPPQETEPDWEAELALVIGTRAKDVDAAGALAAIGGYTGFNDVSGRKAQMGDGQWIRGKSFDTFAPMGPSVVSAAGVDWSDLAVRCTVSGKRYQDGTSSNLIFDVVEVVRYCAAQFTLDPGDVIATGTPAGVGFGLRPQVWLEDGDVVEVEIGDAGVLRNPVVRPGRS
jgi:2-keto-4-pentenoate hydratase/2-oxohepta-3-ene-1,7-dioic acid hydratase in catechol pathway